MALFQGGIHPDDRKQATCGLAIVDAPVPDELIVPLAQHIGKPATAIVKAGDPVRRGQLIGAGAGFVSVPVHSPVSGQVVRLVESRTAVGTACQAILLANDRAEAWAEGCDVDADPSELPPEALRIAIQQAGIVGLGGATFPTHVKLSPPAEKKIEVALLNGAECEPYLTGDHRLMVEAPRAVAEGFRLAARAAGATRALLGIEENKPDAADALERACREIQFPAEVRRLPVCYPQGAEKQLIRALLGREVPSGGLPMDVGAVVVNAATAFAIREALCRHRPLTERIVTISGPGVERPGNLRVRIGTPISLLLRICGFRAEATRKVVLGGPLMGLAQHNLELPVSKGTGGVLCLTDPGTEEWRDCIRCGRCVDACPSGLVPSELSIFGEAERWDEMLRADARDCIECGCCAWICPARRPIVHWIKVAKTRKAAP